MENNNFFDNSSNIYDESSSLFGFENNESNNLTGNSVSETASFTTTTYKSKVWNHFTRDTNFKNNSKAICNYCKAIYICSQGSTTTIMKHLEKNHPTKLNLNYNKSTIENFFNTTKVYIKFFLYLKFKVTINN